METPIVKKADTPDGIEDVAIGYHDVSEVIIPAFIEKNYNQDTKEQFCQRVIGIREEISTIGDSMLQTAKYLSEIKENLQLVRDKKGQGWTAFINSKLIELSPRACTALANAWQKWLSNSEIRPELVQNLSSRSLNAMANADEEARERVYNALEGGTDLTEAEVRGMLNPSKPKPKLSKKVEKQLKGDETKEQVIKFYGARIDAINTEKQQLDNKVKALEAKNTLLIKELAVLKDKKESAN